MLLLLVEQLDRSLLALLLVSGDALEGIEADAFLRCGAAVGLGEEMTSFLFLQVAQVLTFVHRRTIFGGCRVCGK